MIDKMQVILNRNTEIIAATDIMTMPVIHAVNNLRRDLKKTCTGSGDTASDIVLRKADLPA